MQQRETQQHIVPSRSFLKHKVPVKFRTFRQVIGLQVPAEQPRILAKYNKRQHNAWYYKHYSYTHTTWTENTLENYRTNQIARRAGATNPLLGKGSRGRKLWFLLVTWVVQWSGDCGAGYKYGPRGDRSSTCSIATTVLYVKSHRLTRLGRTGKVSFVDN